MKKTLILVLMVFMAFIRLSATSFSDDKMEEFFGYLLLEEYSDGIDHLFEGSILEEKLSVQQTRQNWIGQFRNITNQYGDYLGYEKVGNTRLGELELTIYFVYCRDYLFKIEITEYFNGESSSIVNFVFNDQVLDSLAQYGSTFSY